MAGLSHFQNSLSGINKFEPVYLNQFEVTIIPPAAVAGGEILLQHVNKVSGLSLDKNPSVIAQKFNFAKRNYAGSKPENTYIDVSLSFTVNLNDANSMYIFKTLRQWSDLIYNPLTGAMGLKKDYTGNILISMYNKQGDVYRRINCKDVFPLKPLPEMGLNYTDEGIYTVNDMEFAVDYWDDLFL
jgi:hypothetical protein